MFDSKKAMELQNLRCVQNFKKLTIPQMIERRKLIELLESAESAVYWDSSDKGFIEKIADHLIANGVRIIVPCGKCEHWHEETGWCTKHSHFIGFDGMACHPSKSSEWKMFDADYFCKDGERRSNE